MIKKLSDQKNFYLIISLIFLVHLTGINFHPTNFEGGYGAFANFFEQKNKHSYVKEYFNSQFNSYFFSFLGSLINKLLPFIDGFQSIKLISASSYFFLGLGILNILNFFNFKNNRIFFLLIVFFNSIIWSYGFRAFNDLFAYSTSIYFFSRILIAKKSNSIYLNSLFLGITTIIKSYNLIFLIPLIFFIIQKNKKKITFKISKIFLLIILPFLIYHLLIFHYFDFFLAPENQDLQVAIFGNDKNRNIFWILNNFIFYIGYLTLITLPFSIIFYLKIYSKVDKKIILSFILIIFLSLYLQNFLFISSELDLGPIQKYFPTELYKTLILICFFFFIFLIHIFFKNKSYYKKNFNIFFVIICSILFYLFVLSFIKASQRYLILPLPFFLLLFFTVIQPRVVIILVLVIYSFFNLIIFLNYYITGKSSQKVWEFMLKKDLIENTNPGVMIPHVYHLYDICYMNGNYNCAQTIKNSVKLKSSNFKVVYYENNAIYSSTVEIFNFKFKKFSIIDNTK